MRIGIMLRSLEERGGIGVYSENLVRELIGIDANNQYVLFYRDPANLGRFARNPNATERLVSGANKAIWDQILIPYHCRKEKIDVIFHPKFTVPLLAPCKAVMVVHGADWFIPEQAKYYSWFDVHYVRAIMPLYFQKSSVVVSVSKITTENFERAFNLPDGKIKTVYFGPARHFKRITDEASLRKVKNSYGLPEKFILTLTKPAGEGRKNLSRILDAYIDYRRRDNSSYKLVIVGRDSHLSLSKYQTSDDGFRNDILPLGWIEQSDMPAVYSLASLFLYPSNQEAFPIPITEAMACGTPIVTSNINGMKEIAGDAAFFVNPENVSEIADAITQVLSNLHLQQELSEKGLARVKMFSWDKCAREILTLLQSVEK